MLEDHADPLPQDVGVVDQHAAAIEQHVPTVRLEQAVDDAQQRRLARARGADDAGRRRGGDVEVDAPEDPVGAEGEVHVARRDGNPVDRRRARGGQVVG